MKKILSILLLLTLVFTLTSCKKNKDTEIPDKLITYTVPDNYQEFYDDYFYYLPKADLTGKTGSIAIEVFESDKEYSKDYLEELKNEYETYNIKSIKEYQTPNYKGAVVILTFDKFDEIIYHILSGYMTVIVDGKDYHIYPSFQKDIKSIVDSLDI